MQIRGTMLACGKFRRCSLEVISTENWYGSICLACPNGLFLMNQGVAWHGIVFDSQGSTINSSVAPKTCPFSGLKNGPEKWARAVFHEAFEEVRGRSVVLETWETSKSVPGKWARFWASF